MLKPILSRGRCTCYLSAHSFFSTIAGKGADTNDSPKCPTTKNKNNPPIDTTKPLKTRENANNCTQPSRALNIHFNQQLKQAIRGNSLTCALETWLEMKAASVECTDENLFLAQTKGPQWSTLSTIVKRNKDPDLSTFSVLFTGIGHEGDVKQAQDLLEWMTERRIAPNTFIFNTVLLLMLQDATRHTQASSQLLGAMRASGVVPDVATYNMLMNIKRKSGALEECFGLFEEMKASKLIPDVHSYNILLQIRSKQRDEAGFTKVLQSMLANNIPPTRTSFNLLLRIVADRGDITSCRNVFTQIKQRFGSANQFAYHCLLECLAKCGDAIGFKEALMEMQQLEMEPDTFMLNTVLKYFSGSHELHTMLKSVTRDARTFNILLSTATAQEDVATVVTLLREMDQAGVKPNTFTYNIVLRAIIAFKNAQGDDHKTLNSIEYLNAAISSMRQLGVPLDDMSYQLLFMEAAENQNFARCQQLVEEMTQNGILMTSSFYVSVISTLAKRGAWKASKDIFEAIRRQRDQTGDWLDAIVEARMYDVMLSATAKHASFQDCMSLYNEMLKQSRYSATTFNTMVHAAAANKLWSECYHFLDKMKAHNFTPSAYSYTPLISQVLACGDLPQYRRLFAIVKATNIGDKALYHTMHNALQALLVQDKWKHIHAIVLEELQILLDEMQLKRVDKPNPQAEIKPTSTQMPHQNVESMLACL